MLFPEASANVFCATLIVQVPSVVGVNVAVYILLDPAKLDKVPFTNVISASAKFVVTSFDVKVKLIDVSLVVSPLVTVD